MAKPPSKITGDEFPEVLDVSSPIDAPESTPVPLGTDVSVYTREIDNGFVTSESFWNNETGEHEHKETFSENAPEVSVTIDKK